MKNFGKLTLSLLFALLVFSLPLAAQAQLSAQNIYFNEKRAIASLETIIGAQATFLSTHNASDYGSLAELYNDNLIDAALASGEKHGYRFVLTVQNRTPNSPAAFQVVAVPRVYRRTGRRSFFLDSQSWLIRGADKQGAAATANDFLIAEHLTCDSESDCEAKAINVLRTLHSVEATFQATSDNGNYGSLCELRAMSLIDELIATGNRNGYLFVVSTANRIGNQQSAAFQIIAIPRRYPQTGRRSFFVDEIGVIRGSDRNGAPATANDQPIEY